jgi:hypothetical protein
MNMDPDEIRRTIREKTETARAAGARVIENPLGLAIGAWALGFLVGLILPISEIEQRSLTPLRDKIAEGVQPSNLIEQAKRVLRDATTRGEAL